MKQKMPEIHVKYARQLEEEGQVQQAEAQFLQGNQPKEAVMMSVICVNLIVGTHAFT